MGPRKRDTTRMALRGRLTAASTLALASLVAASCGGAPTAPIQSPAAMVAPSATPPGSGSPADGCVPPARWNGSSCAAACGEGNHEEPGKGCVSDYPEGPLLAFDRDPKHYAIEPKVEALLVTELANRERDLKALPEGSPDRPAMLLRMGAMCVELEASAARSRLEAVAAGRSGAKSEKVQRGATSAGTGHYTELADDFSGWCPGASDPKGSCGDEGLYYRGWLLERASRFEDARASYELVVDRFPKSRLSAYAYFAFGEMHAREALAKNDAAKWQLADDAYREAAKRGGAEVEPHTLLRRGQWLELRGDKPAAQALYGDVLKRFPKHLAAARVPKWAKP